MSSKLFSFVKKECRLLNRIRIYRETHGTWIRPGDEEKLQKKPTQNEPEQTA
jgi:hypothetical protein